MKVLIGIATQNRASILPRAIESALGQDYSNKEVAIFDDGSNDETSDLRRMFPQVSWYRSDVPVGIAAARTHLMRTADTDLYFSLDDDAWFMKGDEISIAVKLMTQQRNLAAVAFDILSADRPALNKRVEPHHCHSFIGCGHMLRLSAAKEVNYYTPNPGFYGSEEKDLSLRLLNQGYEILYLPGVHVWHDKTPQARNISAQHISGVCNDLVFAYRRCPLPMALWLIPGKALNHLRFSIRRRRVVACLKGFLLFSKSIPVIAQTREPVSRKSFRKFLQLSRASR